MSKSDRRDEAIAAADFVEEWIEMGRPERAIPHRSIQTLMEAVRALTRPIQQSAGKAAPAPEGGEKPVAWPSREQVAKAIEGTACAKVQGEWHPVRNAHETADAVMALYAHPSPSAALSGEEKGNG